MFVKPREGYTVRDPENPRRILPPEGGNVPETQYWHQRIIQGDVFLAEAPADDEPGEAAAQADADAVKE